jgi:hypothetical protein
MSSSLFPRFKINPETDLIKSRSKGWWLFLKWLILIAAYFFLAYKLLTFNQYDELIAKWAQIPLSHFGWLLLVLILLPANWLLEALKWKKLTSNVQKISIATSFKAVLAGISSGFFTPNRVGELVGRVIFLDGKNRKAGVTLCIVNSLTQNIIMALCGIPACIVFFSYSTVKIQVDIAVFLWALVGTLIIFGLLYFALPYISKLLSKSKIAPKIISFTSCLSLFNSSDLILIIAISLLRYFVFCFQFFLMLFFFGIQLEFWQALIAIPASYLFVTFTPSVAFSEAAVRSSYALIFIGAFSGQIVGIALAGVCIWLINFVFPMLVGSVMLVKNRG